MRILNVVRGILRIGMDDSQDLFLKTKILSINFISAIFILMAIILFFINLYAQIYLNALLAFVTIPAVLCIYLLIHKKKFTQASYSLFYFLLVISIAACYSAYQSGRFTDTENIYYFLIVLSVFLFEGIEEKIQSLLLVSIFFFFKVWRIELQQVAPMYLFLVNASLFVILTYSLVSIFKSTLNRVITKLEHASKEKDQLFYIVSHDMRRPLNNFEDMLNASIDGLMDKEHFALFAKETKKQIQPLKATVDELLSWSVNQLGGLKSEPVSFQIVEVVDQVLSQLQIDLEQKQMTLQKHVADELVYCDQEHLTIILRNIVHNAIKYSEKGTTINLNIGSENGTTKIQLSDHGIGMSEDQIASILQRDRLKDRVGTSGEIGSGFGLRFCMDLIAKNRGQLLIESELGQGSVFTVSLPARAFI